MLNNWDRDRAFQDVQEEANHASQPYPFSTADRATGGPYEIAGTASIPTTLKNLKRSGAFLSKYSLPMPMAIQTMRTTQPQAAIPLSLDFQPDECTVICGRGKAAVNRDGNRRFKAIVDEHIDEYRDAVTKADKSSVVNSILDKVRRHPNARFVAQKKGRWFEISEEQAREKVGHTLREAIAKKHQSLGGTVAAELVSSPWPADSAVRETDSTNDSEKSFSFLRTE